MNSRPKGFDPRPSVTTGQKSARNWYHRYHALAREDGPPGYGWNVQFQMQIRSKRSALTLASMSAAQGPNSEERHPTSQQYTCQYRAVRIVGTCT
jgi:hypothetical protein